MSSQLNVDTIVDKAGSGGTNVKIANTSTYVSEGGATTQNTVQGLAKVWIKGDTTASLLDSFNVATNTDVGTGVYEYAPTNIFSNSNFSQVGMASSTDQRRNITQNAAEIDSSTIPVELSDANTLDDTNHCIAVFGDLA